MTTAAERSVHIRADRVDHEVLDDIIPKNRRVIARSMFQQVPRLITRIHIDSVFDSTIWSGPHDFFGQGFLINRLLLQIVLERFRVPYFYAIHGADNECSFADASVVGKRSGQ